MERKGEEREKMNTEAKEEESRSGKREVEGEKEKVETSSKRVCLYRLSRKCSRSSVPCLSWRVLGIPWIFVCACFASVCACGDCSCLGCEFGL